MHFVFVPSSEDSVTKKNTCDSVGAQKHLNVTLCKRARLSDHESTLFNNYTNY